LTSLKSRVYSADVSAGGGPGSPNVAPLGTSSGVTAPIHGTIIGRKPGGVGRHTPGAGAWVNRMGALRPSSARIRIRRSAARMPKATPRVLDRPSGICASDVA
jgi:hypothetical protein